MHGYQHVSQYLTFLLIPLGSNILSTFNLDLHHTHQGENERVYYIILSEWDIDQTSWHIHITQGLATIFYNWKWKCDI